MKLIVAGSREGIPKDAVHYVLDEEIDVDDELEIVSGGARGVDKFGEEWAFLNNVDVKRFPADWKQYGKRAGFVRNAEMARYGDMLFAFHDGISKGTLHMINVMKDLKKPVYVFHVHPGQPPKRIEDEDEE